ncbi:Acr-17 [Aphelenchoides besseyi]|nr:Acr-17 [Aphelenchoides besseyi]
MFTFSVSANNNLQAPFIPECTADASLKLYNHLFKNYRKEIRPVDPHNPSPTNVTVQLFLKQIQNVHESDQIISLYCWLELYWQDFYLRWNETEFNGTNEIIVPAKEVWRPDLAHMNIEDNQLETNAVIKSDGRISVYRAMVTQITCLLNMDSFPFDQQICYVMLSYDGAAIMLHTLVSTEADNQQADLEKVSSLAHYMPNQEWHLNDFKIRRNLKNPMYYLFTQLLPSTFISVITMIGSFTPHNTTGENQEKVTLGATAGMAIVIILMMIADKLPDITVVGKILRRSDSDDILCHLFDHIRSKRSNAWQSRRTASELDSSLHSTIPLDEMDIQAHRRKEKNCEFVSCAQLSVFLQKTKDCLCMSRSRSNSIIAKINGDCKLEKPLVSESQSDFSVHKLQFAPPYTAFGGTDPNYQRLLQTINDIRCANQCIAERLEAEHQLKEIRRDWEYLARGIDTLLLTFFVFFSVLYQFWLFSQTNVAPLKITESFMNLTSAA